MSRRYIVQRQYGEWCVMDAHAHINVTIAVGCPIGQGGTEAGREYAERIAQGMNERNKLRATIEMLCNGLEWHIENHPLIMNEADNEALAEARAVLEEEIRTAAGACPDCGGEGRIPSNGCGDQAGGWAETCQECKGTGRVA